VIGDLIQPTHLIFVMVVALLVLGPKRLPEVGRQLGKGLRDFRGAMSGIDEHRQDLFDSAKVHLPADDPAPEPVMATATSAAEPSLNGAGTEESPAVAPRNDELPS
jgi:sec-independent protein translocase protein TatA